MEINQMTYIALVVGSNSEWLISYVYWRCSCKIRNYWFGCIKKYFLIDLQNFNNIFKQKNNRTVMPLTVEISLKA